MNLKISVILIATSLALTACGPKATQEPEKTKASPATLMDNPKVQAPPASAVNKYQDNMPKPDGSVPLSSYADINSEPSGMALTYIVLAKSTTPLSNNYKLNQLSPIYYHEIDVFKKRDLEKTELPRIEAVLDKYRKQSYYSIPILDYVEKPIGLTNIHIGHYDFNTKSFKLDTYGQSCWTTFISNQQNASLKILPTNFTCNLLVTDEAQAKLIETARAHNNLGMQGTLYVFIPRAESATALAVVSHAHIELVNTQTKAMLAKFDL